MNFNLMLRSLCAGLLVVIVALLPAIFSSCKDNTGPETPPSSATSASISGTVVGKKGTGSTVQLGGAVVSLHTIYGVQDTLTDAHGGFQFIVQFPDSAKASNATISASKLPDYDLQTQNLIIRPGSDVVVPFTLLAKDTTILPSFSGPIANFVFISQTSTYANVKGYAGIQIVSFTFEARDSAGVPVDTTAAHRAKVYFKLQPTIGGGEKLSADSLFTSNSSDKRGRATVDFQVGTIAGIVQVQAWAKTPSGTTLFATSMPLPIYSGSPSIDHFQMSADVVNFPGLNVKGLQNKINVQIGDRWSNPVRQGTPVVFSSSSGIIQPTAETDADGKATVTLTSGDPQPANGIAYVRAQTVGDSGKIVKDSIAILVTGTTNILPLSDSLYITISGGDLIHVPYHVRDVFGHPLAAGTKIKVALAGDAAPGLVLSGDVDVTLADTKDPAFSSFAFDLRDTVHTAGDDKSFQVTVSVTSPNGNLARAYSGTAAGTPGGGGATGAGPANKVASIVLSDVSDRQISVQGTGAKQSSVLTFLVLDHNGRFIPRDSAVIHFSLYPTTLGAYVFPDSAKTDAQGHVQAVLNSGKTSGVVQVMAYADTGKGPRVFSSPVPVTIASGLPVISHYSLAVSRFNIPGLAIDGLADSLTAFVGDINGNPVQPNTAVYFKTDGGIVQPSSYTNVIGQANSILRSANPRTANGIVTVTASTIDTSGSPISRTALVIFSGPPIINVATDTIFLSSNIEKTRTWTVADRNGNPLAMGNIISATLIGNNVGQVKMSGDVSTTLGDYPIGAGLTNFHVALVDTLSYRIADAFLTLRISATGPNGTTAPIDVPVKLMKSTNPSIALIKKIVINADQNRIYVSGTGALSSSHLTFNIQDANGNSIPIKGMPINVNLSGAVGTVDSSFIHTDSLGYAYATFFSGSDTGTAFVVGQVGDVVSIQRAITILPGKPSGIYSSLYIVRLPDTLQKINIPGAGINNAQKVGEIHVKVRDRYNNAVQPGTSVRVLSTAGQFATGTDSITLSTDKKGEVSTDLFGGNPTPANGQARLTISLSGENGALVTKNLDFVYSGAPVVSFVTPLTANFVFKNLVDTSFTFSVKDINGNPLSAGETIAVSVVGAGGSMVKLSGDISKTMGDTRDTNNARFIIHIQDTNRVVTNDMNLGLVILVDGPNGTKRTEIDGTLKAAPPSPFKLLTFKSMTFNPIIVTGVGGQQTTQLMFEIQDSTGKAIQKSGIDVQFTLASLSASISPQHDTTDAIGQIRVTVSSGTSAETLQVRAIANGIYSPIQQIIVQAGPPDQAFFGLQLTGLDGKKKTNFPGGFGVKEAVGFAQVQVKDIYGNIVKIGTAIKFTKNAGSMAAFSFTDKNGIAQATWLGGVPYPANGNAYVTASALDNSNNVIAYDSVNVMYSGQAVINEALPANYVFRHGIDTTITYTVKDANGNPLSAGSTIQITAAGDGASSLVLLGNVDITMPDTRDTNATKFSFRVRDTNTTNTNTRPVSITIAVAGPNGTALLTNTGTLAGAPPAVVAGLGILAVNPTTINVKDGGGTETTLLTFEIRDQLDHPIQRQGVNVLFTSQGVPGSFTPASASTDSMGRVSTLFHSDSIAGVVRIVGTINGTGITSTSQKLLIVGGKPAQNYFTFILTRPQSGSMKQNFPGEMPIVQKIGEAQVQVGDKYGNPVPAGTPIYFKTTAGVIQGSAETDQNGYAKVDWFGGNPRPAGDSAIVTASTLGANSQNVFINTVVTYSGPALVIGGLPANYVLKSGIDTTISYTVSDANGNPLAEGSTIQVMASDLGASSILLMGDVNVTMPDTRSKAMTLFSVRLRDTNTVLQTQRSVSFSIQVNGPNGFASQLVNASLKGITPPPIVYPTVAGLSPVIVSAGQLNVANSGGIENSLLSFELRDSLNNPIHKPGVRVDFSANGVGGSFNPAFAMTDSTGRAQTIFYSGVSAGIVEVKATALSGTISSGLLKIVIVGGKPNQKYFTVVIIRPGQNSASVNYPGALPIVQKIGQVQVQMGDRYGNPVPQGTPVYFTTNAGIIQGSAVSDANGFAQVDWFGGNPVPLNGQAILTASAIGLNDTIVSRIDTVIYSGQTIITGGPVDGFQIVGGGTATYNFKIADANNNPISAGNTIQFTASGPGSQALILTGDMLVTTSDIKNPASVNYSVTVRDTSTFSSQVREVVLAINVTGPNGSAHTVGTGLLLSTGGGRSKLPGTIALISTSANDIQVTGTGGIETATMVFELRDSVGVPVDSTYMVKFSLIPKIGGAFISPDSGFCDPNTGRINAVIHAGTVSGALQAVATYSGPSGNIISTPVRILVNAGQPDSTHFSIGANPVNIAGLDINGLQSDIGIILGDKYSNPVPLGTAVYFSTTEGIVTTNTGFTDKNGAATVTLYSANPRSADGFGFVTARTVGANGADVHDSVRVLFSGTPIIDSVRVTPSNTTNFNVSFRVYDRNRHPLAAGTTIGASVSGHVSVITSDIIPSFKIPDTQDPFWTKFSFNVVFDRSVSPPITGPFTLTINVSGPNGNTSYPIDADAKDQGNVIITRTLTGVGGLKLAAIANPTISVKDAGGLDLTTVTYQLTDSIGLSFPQDSIMVVFNNITGPTLGSFGIDSALTDVRGQASTIFRSSTHAGIAEISARVSGSSFVSTPSKITITGGHPDSGHTTLTIGRLQVDGTLLSRLNHVNFPGQTGNNSPMGLAQVRLGDKYDNPVPSGTPVYYTTNAGLIAGSSYTDSTGYASVTWYSGQPYPPNGTAIVQVSAIGQNAPFTVSDTVTYSGTPILTTSLPSNFVLPAGVDTVITYTALDANGNPTAGEIDDNGKAFVTNWVTQFVVGGADMFAVSTTGDIQSYMIDTRDPSKATFHVRIRDNRLSNTPDQQLIFGISYVGPNGQVTKTLNGILLANHNIGTVAGINLVALSANKITVKNSGANESSLLTYQIVDSLGNALRRPNEQVVFRLGGAIPGFFTPDTALSDVNGQVQTVFHSDTLAGIARLTAHLTAENLTSAEKQIVIAGGRPSRKFFSSYLTRTGSTPNMNFPGAMPVVQVIGSAQVRAADKYGNPVPTGTPIYFKTNAGAIQSTDTTNSSGAASVIWFGGNPVPSGGNAIVIVSAVSDTGNIADTLVATYSGQVTISGMPSAGFDFHHGIDTTLAIVLKDSLNNPIAAGSSVTFGISGNGAKSLIVTSDLGNGTPDTRDVNNTTAHIHIIDTNSTVTGIRSVTFDVSVSGANGSASASVDGILEGTTSSGTGGPSVAILNLVGISATQLTVKNTGGIETSLLTYQLLDSLGNPIRRSGVSVAFSKNGVAGSFTPASVATDANGQAQTLFHSDTLAGLVNVSAHTVSPVITSSQRQLVIAGGRPSQKFFTFNLTRSIGKNVNFPGAVSVGQKIGEAQIQAGDRYGNPVPQGTFVYFTTNAGVIQSSASTDANGFAKVDWFSGNPNPPGGLAKVKVSAIGDTNTVTDSAIVVYSGAPVVAIVGLASNFTMRHNIDTTFTYTVGDANGNPLAQGSEIQFSTSGNGSSALVITGDVNVTTTDTQDPTKTTFHIHLKDTTTVPVVDRQLSFLVSVSGANGNTSQQVDGTLQGVVTSTTTAGVARLNLISISATQLSVVNGGGTQTSLLTYELEDSLGNPVHQDSVQIQFSANGVQGTFTPTTTITDANGKAQTTFASSTLAGVVEVVATVVGKGITSTQAHLVIVGGKPSLKYFTFVVSRSASSGAKVNYPGAVPAIQNIGQAQVQVGDQYGNPVPLGTTVYFTTNAGVIQGSGSTDANGFAKVDWFGGNPVPLNEVAILQASALSDTGKFTVADTVLYTGTVSIVNGPASGFQIPGAGVATFNYQIADQMANPIAEGSTISVVASGPGAVPLVLSGNINVTTSDTKDPTKTTYTFTAFDSSASSTTNRNVTFTISVNGSNGTANQSFVGTLLAIGASHGVGDTTRSRLPGSIALISVSNTDIQVTGTGGTETSTLVFEVRDSLGIPVDSSYQVKFTLANPPGNAYISPISGRCDSSTGRINAVLHADSVAGVVQVYATVTTPTATVKSSPVLVTIHSGLPDQRHFSLYPSSKNFAGLDLFATADTLNVLVGDKYSNPVATGTAVYFSTHAGVIQPSGFTDANGYAKVIIYSGNPFPDLSNPDPDSGVGFGKVYATTDGLNNTVITDSIPLLFSGVPIVTYTDSTVFSILYGQEKSFNVTVDDRFGHPISPGSVITVIATSTATIKVSDPIVMPDVQSSGPGRTQFQVAIATAPPDPTAPRPQPASVKVYLKIDWMGRTFTVLLASGSIN
jgi:hypothetical protein